LAHALTTSVVSAQASSPANDDITAHPAAATSPDATPFSFRRPYGWAETGPKIDVSGYVLPQFVVVSIPSALPRDRIAYGARGTRAGFALYGTPIKDWSYIAHVVLTPAGTESVAILSPTPEPTIGVTQQTGAQSALSVEQLSIGYRPASWFLGRVGIVRIPFSLGQSTPIPEQMFPFRPPATSEFQSGADPGMLATFSLFDARLVGNLGMFLGSSLGVANPRQTERGPAFVASVAAHPLGAMSLDEGDHSRKPFAFALGFASIYRHVTSFEATGYEATQFDDTRFAAFARASFRGLYVQGEYLRRLQTADLSRRPSASEGGYGEASYYQPIGPIALGPMVRGSILSTSLDFASRKFTSLEAGIAFYPRSDLDEPEKLRIILEYITASTAPLREVQYEGLAQFQMGF
jgi:hypothetical protein